MDSPTTVPETVDILRTSELEDVSLYSVLAPVYRITMARRDIPAAQYEFVTGSAAPTAERVAEFACGPGGLLSLLEDRYGFVVGLDRSPELLSIARERTSAPLLRADVRRRCLGRSFDTVVMLGRSLGHMTTDEDLRSVLRTARETLRPSGRFLFDCHDVAVLDEDFERDRTFETPAYRVEQRTETVAVDAPTNVARSVDTFELTDKERGVGTTVTTEPMGFRFFDADVLETEVERAGFSIVDVESAHSGLQFTVEK